MDLPQLEVRAIFRMSLTGVTPTSNELGRQHQLQRIVEGIVLTRSIVPTYNLLLLGLVLVFGVVHWYEKTRLRKASGRIESGGVSSTGERNYDALSDLLDDSWSSSSSTISVNGVSPERGGKIEEGELDPLLGTKARRKRRGFGSVYVAAKAWLQYQPAPIPVVLKELPPNYLTVLVLGWLAIVLFYNFYAIQFDDAFLFVFIDRAGLFFAANLPLLYILGAKTQPLKALTGHSYEALNIFHRRLGEILCFEALMHFLGMMALWYTLFQHLGFTLRVYLLHPRSIYGLVALFAYETLFATSLRSFRQRCYELFLALHIVLQVIGLAFLWLHYHTARPYVYACAIIYALDRLVFRLFMKSSTHVAFLEVLPDGETILVSANWDVVSKRRRFPLSLLPNSTASGWKPTDHVFFSVPLISLEAHPFTIYSAAPPVHPQTNSFPPASPHTWFTLLIRAHSGFTRKLLEYSKKHPQTKIRLDGPYGSSHALDTLSASRNSIIVAGGSGIAVAYPLLWALLSPSSDPSFQSFNRPSSSSSSASTDIEAQCTPPLVQTPPRKVRLLWIVHSSSHLSWLPEPWRKELGEWGLELVIPPPTAEAGRPDVGAVLSGWIDNSTTNTAVVVSGPDSLVRDVRNRCAGFISEGKAVDVCVEKFGW